MAERLWEFESPRRHQGKSGQREPGKRLGSRLIVVAARQRFTPEQGREERQSDRRIRRLISRDKR